MSCPDGEINPPAVPNWDGEIQTSCQNLSHSSCMFFLAKGPSFDLLMQKKWLKPWFSLYPGSFFPSYKRIWSDAIVRNLSLTNPNNGNLWGFVATGPKKKELSPPGLIQFEVLPVWRISNGLCKWESLQSLRGIQVFLTTLQPTLSPSIMWEDVFSFHNHFPIALLKRTTDLFSLWQKSVSSLPLFTFGNSHFEKS